MPGFYKHLEDGSVAWRDCYRLFGGLEMTFQQTDILLEKTLPRARASLLGEGVDPGTFDYEFGKDGSGDGYIAVTGIAPTSETTMAGE